MEVLNYKCPNCTAPLTFDSGTQKMVCDFCGSSYTLQELETLGVQGTAAEDGARAGAAGEQSGPQKGEHWEGFRPEEWQTADMQGMKVWSCPSCGAEVIAEETTGATKCPYCDNPMIMPEQFSGMYLPDYIIPFKRSKKEAVAALKNHYLGKPLLPRVFKDENHMEEIRAVYVPFWMFDAEADGDFRFEGVRTRFYEDQRFQYTEESFYDVRRAGRMRFVRIPVDGSKKIDDTMMEAIEPYDYRDLEPFQISYLSGYMANKYDMEPDMLTDRVMERMEQSVRSYFQASVSGGYSRLVTRQQNVRVTKRGKVKYGLFPVWFLNTKWRGKSYAFVMNGQTGRFIGDLPVGKDMLAQYWVKRHIPLTIAMTVVMIVLRLAGVM